MDLRYRLARCRYYLYLYNRQLRHTTAKRSAHIIGILNHMWERMGEGERKFILHREEW